MIVTEREARSCWPGTFLVEEIMEITEQNEIKPPTHYELSEEECDDGTDIKTVLRESDDSWRHGSYIRKVFHRVRDNTYWEANFVKSPDGEINTLCDGSCGIVRVETSTRIVEVTEYKEVK